MRSIFFLSLVSLARFASASVCQSSIYNGLSCLTSDAAASSYCLTIADGLAFVSPTTTQAISTATEYSTTTVTDASRSSVTITSVVVLSLTTTISSGALSTVYAGSTTLETFYDTTTTYVTSLTSSPSTTAASASCDTTAANSKLSSLNANQASTACSCLDLLPSSSAGASQATVVETVTETAVLTTTVVETGQVRFTMFAATTISETITSAMTQTQTVSLAAPTFTKVWGPKEGCLDAGLSTAEQLDTTATQDDAVVYCKDECSKQSECDFVWVQYTFPDYGAVTPFWECSFNSHPFNETSDVQCGKSTKVWGKAFGYSALDRGQDS